VRLVPLGSGSRGNAAFVQLGSTSLLVDAGLSARKLAELLEAVGVAPGTIDGILISHEHSDHTRGVERFSRKHGAPVLCSRATLEAMDRSPAHFAEWQPLGPGAFDLGEVQIETFPVPHDAAAPVGFVLHGEGLRVGIATDLGHATTLVRERLRGCHVQMVESNHDDKMLRDGPYPWQLKQRVAGRLGHLSNREAAAVLGETADQACRAVILAHLSEKNNTPELARRAVAGALEARGGREITVRVATADGPTQAVEL